MQSWSYQELFTKSDFVIIAKPRAGSRDTTERSTLRDIAVPVIGVATEFQTLLVLKGRTRERFTLHHYRLREPDVAWIIAVIYSFSDVSRAAASHRLQGRPI
jgi:hypothetical protein